MLNQSYTGVKIIGISVVLFSLAGCGAKNQAQATKAESAAADQEMAAKRAAIEANPNIPADKKAKALGAMGSSQSVGTPR